MTQQQQTPLSQDELAAEAGTALPDKEVISSSTSTQTSTSLST